jgi:hypothetical protein
VALPNQSEKSVALDREENVTKGNLSAKRVALYTYNSGNDQLEPFASGLAPGIDFDYVDVQQTSPTVETYVFKTGGSGGTTVRTIVVNYTDSTKSDIDNVSWS